MPIFKISPYERELLLAHILGKSREYVLTHPEIILTSQQKKKLAIFIKRREQNEPLSYILGHKEFYGIDFKVNSSTLIPRPETELMVEAAICDILDATSDKPAGHRYAQALAGRQQKISVIDVGTGSGNIIIAIANNCKNILANFYGLDISLDALRIAKQNSKKYNLNNPRSGGIKFIASDTLEYFRKNISLLSPHCIITANLPYLSRKIYTNATTDVRKFEPKSALYSSKDGLAHYEKLFRQIKSLQKKNHSLRFFCLIEISPEQKKKTEELVRKFFPKAKPSFQKDLARKWRLCCIRL